MAPDLTRGKTPIAFLEEIRDGESIKIYYWDTCCFIAWLTSKDYPQEVLDGLDDVAKEVNENRAILCTSVMTDTEILEGQLTADQITKFQNLFKRRNVIQITLDQRIARRASEIRNYYNGRGIKIKTPDATHLATAIIYEAEEFHTIRWRRRASATQ